MDRETCESIVNEFDNNCDEFCSTVKGWKRGERAAVKRKKTESDFYQKSPKTPLTFSISRSEKEIMKCKDLFTDSKPKK